VKGSVVFVSRSIAATAIGASLIALAACGRDAAAEQPIEVRPGLYEAKLQHESFGPFRASTPSELDRRKCVSPSEADTFPQSFTRKYLSMEDACGGPLAERTGNRISGEVSCPLNKDGGSGNLVTRFEGDVSEEQVDVRAVTKAEDLQGNPEMLAVLKDTDLAKEGIALTLTIKRIGDCPA
jgi:hypothetical protein